MERKPPIRTIRIENLLSYGPGGTELELRPLNVFIGPNASGKSNLIELLSILAAAPRDMRKAILEGGGVMDWLWKGERESPVATLEVTLENPDGPMPLRHRLSFSERSSRFDLCDEVVENESPFEGHERPYFYYAYQDGHPALNVLATDEPRPTPTPTPTPAPEGSNSERRVRRSLHREEVKANQSILSQRRGSDSYPELTHVARIYEQIKFYREWNLGRLTAARSPQKADLPEDCLLEDASNLGLVLNELQNRPDVKEVIIERLERIEKRSVFRALERATQDTQKGAYRKGRHGFELLGRLDPATVESSAPHAKRLLDALRGGARG